MNAKQRAIVAFLLTASVLISVLSGCAPGQIFGPTITPSPTITPTPTLLPDQRIVGIWLVFFDWDCEDGGTAASWDIRSNGVIIDFDEAKEDANGSWSLDGDTFTRDYDTGPAVYTGTVSKDFTVIIGTMKTSSDTGCWSAVKIR